MHDGQRKEKRIKNLLAGAAIAMLIALVGSAAARTTIVISCGAIGREHDDCREGAKAWEKKTNNRVTVLQTSTSSTDRLDSYQKDFAEKFNNADVIQIDVVWVNILSEHLLDFTIVNSDEKAIELSDKFRKNAKNNSLIAIPWINSVGQLYYRPDILKRYRLEVPETWEDLVSSSKIIMDGERREGDEKCRRSMWGYVFQGHAYEGLTVNALEWLHSYNAGGIIEANGQISINNPEAVKVLSLVRSWIDDISPCDVLTYTEEDARDMFQSGKAVFMRNWPYACRLLTDVESVLKDKSKVGVIQLPKGGPGGKRTGATGGELLAVSRYSNKQKEAVALVHHLVEWQEKRREKDVNALCKDSENLRLDPPLDRPSGVTGVRYDRVSEAFWRTVHTVLSGRGDAVSELGRLERTLDRIMHGGRRVGRE